MSRSQLRFKNFILAIRPKTLTAAIVPLLVSSGLVLALGQPFDVSVLLCAGGASIFIQIATNLLNDAIDFKKGADTKDRIGPTRVTQSGLLEARQVMAMGFVCLAAAVVLGIPLLIKGGIPILLIGLVSVFLAYSYTGGPFPLAYLGLGDLFVILFFGIIAVSGLTYLHTGEWSMDGFVAGLQTGFLATTLIAVNNGRDIAGDKLANKKTLAVRFGSSFVRGEILILFILAMGLNLYWSLVHGWYWIWLSALALPKMRQTIYIVFKHPPSPVYNQALASAAQSHILFGVLLSLGFYLSRSV